ncbi:MAG: type II toxin-antitoxin system VapC family toxin [Coriobacteriales bacterium]|jgi:predicted nucleic acid-binding protein|nr:type II toxin-antitoxin system VapC family toxin [Coriobacteriales bacterium]
MNYLIDTNVLSELAKDKPDPQATAWFSEHINDKLLISVITVGEIAYGIEKMEAGKKRAELKDWFESMLLEWFDDSIVPINEDVMFAWARLRATSRTLPILDSLIAASVLSTHAVLATRNIRDFEGIEGLETVNPWDDASGAQPASN